VNDEPIAADGSPAAAAASTQTPAVDTEGATAQAQGPQATAATANPWNDPRLPWEGKPRRADIACWAAITLSGLYYLVLLPFRASLVGTHPVLLELLNGSTEAIVSAAAFARVGHGSIPVVLLASIPGLMKFDIIYWWAGRIWGERIILLFSGRRKHGARFIGRVRRWGRKFTWPAMIITPFLPIPNAIVYAVAGWSGMSWVTFLILDAIGSLAWAGMLAGLGWSLGQHAVSVAQEISKYGLWISIGIVVLVVAGQMRNAKAQR
jgi:membrane protein DedA with SNARE-associated domain